MQRKFNSTSSIVYVTYKARKIARASYINVRLAFIMADAKVNRVEGKSTFAEDENEERLLADDGEESLNRDIAGDPNIDPKLIWLGKEIWPLGGNAKYKNLRSKTDKSNNDSETPPGASRKRGKKASSRAGDTSDNSDRDVTAMLEDEVEVEEQDGDSSDKLLREIEEYNTEDKTGPDVNVHLVNHINKRFAG